MISLEIVCFLTFVWLKVQILITISEPLFRVIISVGLYCFL